MLPKQVIERLFSKFTLIYGKAFADMWATIDAELLKGEWADALEKYSLEELKLSLDYCRDKVKYPPNLAEFKIICDGFHKTAPTLKLGRKFTELDRMQNKDRLNKAIENFTDKRDYRGWAKKILNNPENYAENAVLLATEALAEKRNRIISHD